MGNLFLIMSDYDYYGDERPPPPMDGKDGMDGQNGMDGKDGKDYEEKGGKKTQVMMAFALVPLGDLFTYYKINDFNTAATSEWTLAANVSLAAGVLKFVSIGASMVVKSKALMMVPAISVIQELLSLYFINAADGTVASSDSSIYYGVTGVNFIVSAGVAKMAMSMGKKGKKDGMDKDGMHGKDGKPDGKDGKPDGKDGKPDGPPPQGGDDEYYDYY